MVKTLKNVVEGLGLGVISDSVLEGMQLGLKGTKGKVSDAFKQSRKLTRNRTGKG